MYICFQSFHDGSSPCTDQKCSKYVSASLSKGDSVRRRQLSRMRKRSAWFLSPLSKGNVADESALVNQTQPLSNDASGIPGYLSSSPTFEQTDQSLPLDSGVELSLPQLCINDSVALDSDSLEPAFGFDTSGLDNNSYGSALSHSPASAIVDGGSAERLSSVASRSSAASNERSPHSSSDVSSRQRTVENYANELVLPTPDGNSSRAVSPEIRWQETTSDGGAVDHSPLLGQSTDLENRIATSAVDSCRPTSPNVVIADHASQLEAHYFVIDRFYGGCKSMGKTNGGNF